MLTTPERTPAGIMPIRPLQHREFRLFQKLIETHAGIHLSDDKRALLAGRLMRRLRELGMPTFAAYHERIASGDEAELTHMLDRISTNETHFFREPRQFEFLREKVFPLWEAQARAGRRPHWVRAWSAACSTGEEAYTLGMVLLDAFAPAVGWRVDVLGTDLSTRALARARDATWPVAQASEIPSDLLRRFMLRGRGGSEGLMRAGPTLRAVVHLDRVNLNASQYPVRGPFDLILCRNVLMYFGPQTKRRVVEGLLGHLAPHGLILLGHAESAIDLSERLALVGPGVYRDVESPGRGADDLPVRRYSRKRS